MNLKNSRFPSTASMLLVVVAAASLILAWPSALLGTPTAEAALFLGVFLAPLTLLAGACRGASRNVRGFQNDLLRESGWVFGTVFVYLFCLYLHSFELQSCSLSAGILPFAILIVPQLFLNLVTGIWIGRWLGKIQLAVLASIFLWLGYIILQVSLWWLNPSMRFVEPYWLMIGGDLLQGQFLDPALVAYRFSGVLYALAILVLGIQWKQHATQFWLIFFLVSSAVLIHWKSVSLIAPSLSERRLAYPDQLIQGNLVLHTNLQAVGKEHAQAILQEGNLWLQRLKERSGIESDKPIDIWLYQSRDSLARFTGAKNVHFTLPRHREIHITDTQVPHPTLGHELAHVLLGQESKTLWGLPGILGLIPNWGLSEGLATYLTPELNIRDDLSTQEQAVALYRLNLERHPEDLLFADVWSFWIQSSTRAYTSTANILGAYLDSQCHTALCRFKWIKRLVSAGEVTFSPQFMTSYRQSLEHFSLPPDALVSVSKRFGEPSILFSDCSPDKRTVQKLTFEQEGDQLAFQKQFARALAKYEQISAEELTISEQRKLLIKKSFLKETSYANAGLDLLILQPQDEQQLAAFWGRLGASLLKSGEFDSGYDHAAYLLARAQILGGNFAFGLSLMPANLEGLIAQEARRLVALAKSQLNQADQAALEFEFLASQATRPADKIRFVDMKERAERIGLGQSFLLGVYVKLLDNADLPRFQKEN